jgi:pimeloyl-ACP methyl ester carboxylesterase
MQAVEANGLRMTFERRGRGEPVVLVHGYVGDGPSTWRPQLEGLADEYDVIAWDVPGAGGSDDPPESFGMSGFADSLAAFIDVLELVSPHVVGLSFGGAILIEFCRHHQQVPATVTLVGAYAGWAGSLPRDETQRRADQALDLSHLPPQELVDALLPTMFSSTAPRDVVHDFANALASFHPAGLRSMAQACTENLSEVLPTIRVPTLLIYGDDDTRAPQGVAAQLHEAIPNSKLELLPGAGHICTSTQPKPSTQRFDASFESTRLNPLGSRGAHCRGHAGRRETSRGCSMVRFFFRASSPRQRSVTTR